MNQAPYQSQAALILAALQAADGDWVSMPDLAAVGGSYNVHTRIDQLRHEFGHNIENKLVPNSENRKRRDSFYRLITTPQPHDS
jgi:hypothetical protein